MKCLRMLITGLASVLFLPNVFAQTPSYKEMMSDNQYKFYEVVTEAEAYFEVHGKGKGSGWKGYERWKNENESKYAPSGNRSDVDYYSAEKQYISISKNQNRRHQKASFSGWNELGPWDVNNVTSHYSPGIGRVETFWVNPNNENHIFLGSRSGGFWKTTDGGKTWKNTTDFLVASGVESIAVNPENIDEVLIAVQHGGAEYTHGIYRSIDGGTTWDTTKFVPSALGWGGLGDNARIWKVKFHPRVKDQVLVGSNEGLYVSNDNLETWTRPVAGSITDITFHPTNDDIIYAFRNQSTDRNILQKSTDGGLTFVGAGSFANNDNKRIYLSTSSAAPKHVYAASNSGVYKSTDEGATFTFLVNPDENGLAFAVSDLDTNNMIYGYVDLHNSTNNGQSFTQRTRWATQDAAYIHADLRIAGAVNGNFYVGTDGFLAKSTDNGVTWTTLNDGTAIREFYAVGSSQGNFDVHMAGSQDNGTSILNANGWVEWNGGDGMEALIQPLNQNWMVGSWQYGTRNYTRNGGLNRVRCNNPNSGSGNGAWEAPLLLNPQDQMQVIHFSDSVWVGDKFGTEWAYRAAPDVGGLIREAAIADTDSNVMVVSGNGPMKLTTDGGQNWTSITDGLPSYTVTDIAFDPKNAKTIVITYNRYQNDGRKVYISFDQGETWENITYNIGNMPLRTVVIDHSDSSYIYVGGEIGIYYKSMKGTEWLLYDDQLPNVTVKDLEIHYGSNTLRAATWGRGLWENTLIGRNDYPSITHTSITQAPTEVSPKEDILQYVFATVDYDRTISEVFVRWSEGDQLLNNEITLSNIGGDIWKSDSALGAKDLNDMVYFQVIAVGDQNDTSESYVFHYEVQKFAYCDATGGTGTGADYINYVALNGTENSSDKQGYSDFTHIKIELEQGKEYTITAGLNFHFANQDSMTAWIDYNKDAVFESNEQLIFSSFGSDHRAMSTFTVPQDIALNQETRLRVRSQYWSNPMSSCGESAGEVEDYTIFLKEAPNVGINEVNELEVNVFPNPTNGQFEVRFPSRVEYARVQVLDINGKVVAEKTAKNKVLIEMDEALSTGNYLVKIESSLGTATKKLIVK